MKKVIVLSGSLSVILILAGAGFYWLTRPAQINWHRRTRDGISDLRAVDWEGKNLAGANLSGINFRESWLNGANLQGANLQGADLSQAHLEDANLTGANLTGARLYNTRARRANLTGAILKDAQLPSIQLSGANLTGVDLAGANLEDANLAGASLADWLHPPAILDRANLTDADWPANLSQTRLCHTILPNGDLSKQGCFWATPSLLEALQGQEWRWADIELSQLLQNAGISQETAQQLAIDIESIPCQDLQKLDQLWQTASAGRFSFSRQRQLWESATVRQDYGKFADAVGWKQNGDWLKFEELEVIVENRMPPGLWPWHRWQVQEPTETEPTRFRRVGWGVWMNHLKRCNI